jgi:tetratricopeptide (TPR) repeat protein
VRYAAFISYSHADSAVAKRLHRWLESYAIPRRLVGQKSAIGTVPGRLRPIFRDREELPTSANLGEEIAGALRESATLIVICSPRAAASRWVNEEILTFKRLGRSGRILCLIVDGEPNATDKPELSAAECFPPALRFQLADDGTLSTTPAEPIAADMRSGKDGRRDAWLKLAAGIAGVGFDALKQRELQRQLRQAIVVSAASIVLLLTMAALTVAAVVARRDALRQQGIATAERDRAEQNFRDARDAVDRFYTKVSEEQLLKAEGLQPLRAELLREALDYYRRFLSQRKDDPAFALEAAIVQGNVGGILSEVGGPQEALEAAHEATLTLERLHGEFPPDVTITSRLSESLGNEAVNLDRLGRAAEALAAHERAIAVFEGLPTSAAERTLVEWQRLLMAKGAFEAKLGRFAEAARSYERSLEAAAQIDKEIAPLGISLEPAPGGLLVVAVQPRSPAAVAGIRVGDVIKSIAGVALENPARMGDVRGRMRVGEDMAVEILRGGEHVEVALRPAQLGDFLVASTKYNLGYLYLQRLQRPEEAKPWLIESVDEYGRALLKETASAPDVREGLAFAAGVLGTCGYQLGDVELQERSMRESVATSEENVRANPGVPRYRSTLAVNLANIATLLQSQGKLQEAEARCRAAVEQLETALEIGGNVASDRFQLLQVLTNLARMTGDLHGPQAAIPVYDAALKAAEPLRSVEALPQPLSLALAQLNRNRASSLRKTGRFDDSAAAYEEAHLAYDQAVADMTPAPVWLVRESATLECWRAALLYRQQREQAASAALDLFEACCTTLQAVPSGHLAAMQARAAAVEAFSDAARGLLPEHRTTSEAIARKAETQIARLESIGVEAEEEADKQRIINAATIALAGCRLRAGICSDDRATAWQSLSEFLTIDRIDTLPLEIRMDLVASLTVADAPDQLDLAVASVRKDFDRDPQLLPQVRASIDAARRYGIPNEAINRLEEMLRLPPEPIANE